jgi:rubrerythrin
MATAAKVGTNYTGVQMSPKDTKRLLDAVNDIHPDVPGDERGMLGERLAFERNGVRLYEAMIAKARNLDSGNDLVGVLQHIRDEEFEHMMLVHAAMEKLGADPTAQTPSADVAGVMAMGIMQVLTDPRTNVAQCMNALLTAELADNAAWELLIELAQAAGHPNIADSFGHAKTQEDDHLVKIKTLMRRDLVMQTK